MSSYSIALFVLSWLIVAFGQPVWGPWLSFLASTIGFGLFLYPLLKTSSHKFLKGFIWMFAVQLVQLYWFVSHPYVYIYGVYLFLAALLACQWGFFCLIFRESLVKSFWGVLSLASLWTLFEWSREYFFSGFSWNPIGLSLAAIPLSRQSAAFLGIFGLSFLVLATNLFFLKKWKLGVLFASLPFLLGFAAAQQQNEEKGDLRVWLVQPNFPCEESLQFTSFLQYARYVLHEWKVILDLLPQKTEIDLIVLPENVVPFHTFTAAYPQEEMLDILKGRFGDDITKFLPELNENYLQKREGKFFVSNAFLLQTLANYYDTNVIAGLEDVEDEEDGTRKYYSAAYLFKAKESFPVARYEKRVLVPMAEYIPFEWCKQLAQRYGISISLTPGKGLGHWEIRGLIASPSICYEETFGSVVRDEHADFLVNLTNDGWYPSSLLAEQHLSLATLRAVENGIPLLRSCNTGISAWVDKEGTVVAALPQDEIGVLKIKEKITKRKTVYAQFGEKTILLGCLLLLPIGFFVAAFKKKHYDN